MHEALDLTPNTAKKEIKKSIPAQAACRKEPSGERGQQAEADLLAPATLSVPRQHWSLAMQNSPNFYAYSKSFRLTVTSLVELTSSIKKYKVNVGQSDPV